MLMQRNFSEWCKFAYKRKVSKHDWFPEQGKGLVSPAERVLYYMWSMALLTEVRGLWEGQARRARGDPD
jgi:hypothetical protein